jgi:hypothetical protein
MLSSLPPAIVVFGAAANLRSLRAARALPLLHCKNVTLAALVECAPAARKRGPGNNPSTALPLDILSIRAARPM